MLKWVDLPPVWLAGALALAWVQARHWPLGLSFGGGWADLAGGLLVGGGLVLVALAAAEFRRARTTIVPHRQASALVTGGIYSRTRNPIYLADLMILAGLVLYWDAVLSLVLVPLLLWVLERRFVIPEENRLRRTFRADFARYAHKVRRWI
ncbi:methyltransferase family protein [Rhodosalinus sediminis]|uniref:methyltransferase family protein n=1 Tax=Rhodosalinus sediminis TaxID=1940533 RepID=UPI00235439F9|nr:methyltransferase [Rhodosalinus sediminis]